jgi:hypothetical protein
VQSLWGELAELTRVLVRDSPFLPLDLSPADHRLILDFCEKYGLLGLLPSMAIDVRFSVDRFGPAYLKSGSRWYSTEPENSVSRPDILQKAETVLYDWKYLMQKREPTASVTNRYFFREFKDGRWPAPFSDDFWRFYQEPLRDWVRYAVGFVEAVNWVSDCAKQRFNKRPVLDEDQEFADLGLRRLDALKNVDAPVHILDRFTVEESSYSTSLLPILAKQFLSDLERRRRLFSCIKCGRRFVSSDERASYCSQTCRNTASVKRYRDKLKDGAK